MKKSTKYIIAFTSLLLFVVFCVAMEMSSSSSVPKVKVEIKQSSSYGFVDIEALKKYVSDQSKGIHKDSLAQSLTKLESRITKDKYIEKAMVYLLPSGTIKVDLWEKIPTFRVVGDTENKFISTTGKVMPIKAGVSVDVMMVSGDVDSIFYPQISGLIETLKSDEFFRYQTMGIEVQRVKKSGTHIPYFTVQTKLDDLKVALGSMEDMSQKIENFKIIYSHLYADNKLNVYKVVNLEFVNYLICQKK